MLAWDTPLKANYIPPFCLFLMLYIPNRIVTLPLIELLVLRYILYQQTPFRLRTPLSSKLVPASPFCRSHSCSAPAVLTSPFPSPLPSQFPPPLLLISVYLSMEYSVAPEHQGKYRYV